jgi:hypothetical protein
MSRDEEHGRSDLPLDDVTHPSSAPVPESDEESDEGWGHDFADPNETDWFSAEIEDVDASDWDLESAQIWGDDPSGPIDEAGPEGLDIPL